MTDRARMWWIRIALLGGLAWFASQLISYQSSGRTARILGRYSGGYFAFMLLGVIGAVAAGQFVFRPAFRQWVLAERFRLKMAVFAAWLPAGLGIDALGYVLADRWSAQPEWHATFGGLFLAATIAMLLVTQDALRVAARQSEFWLAVAGVVVALGVAEGGARYWIRNVVDDPQTQLIYDPALSDPERQRFVPHHYEGYIPRPGWVSEDGLDQINALGYRGEDITVPKPPGVYRIVTLGGSTTYGTGVRDWRDAYPAQLERVLRDDYGFTQVEVVNGGVGAHNSWETVINFQFRALDLEPDLIIFYQNTNDVHTRIVPPDSYRGDNSGRRKLWDQTTSLPMRFPSVLWRIVGRSLGWLNVEPLNLENAISVRCTGNLAESRCLGMSPAEALEANPPISYERNVRNMVAIAQANGVEVLLLTWAYNPDINPSESYAARPEYQAAFAEHNDIVVRLAGEMDTYFYDFAAAMPSDAAYWTDGRHMTSEGNQVRAELIATYVDEAGILSAP